MNHGATRIFSGRNEPISGRNANIQSNMFKRKQIFEKQSPNQKIQSPFSGYSFTGSSMNSIHSINQSHSLAHSQVSQLNTDLIRRLIRDEIQKNGLNSSTHISENSEENFKNKNELNILKIEVRSIKESYHELNKVIKRRFQEHSEETSQVRKEFNVLQKTEINVRSEIEADIDNKLKEYESSISRSMRTLYQKMQEDIINEYKQYSEGNFVPLEFLNNLDEQLSLIQDKVTHVQAKVSNKKYVNPSESQLEGSSKSNSTLTSAAQLKLNKLEKDVESIRKVLEQKNTKIKELDELIFTNNQKQDTQLRQTITKLNSLQVGLKELKESTSNIDEKIQAYKKKTFQMVQGQVETINRKLMSPGFIRDKAQALNSSSSLQNIDQSSSVILENTKSLSQQQQSDSTDFSKLDEQVTQAVQLTKQKQNPAAKLNNPKVNFTYAADTETKPSTVEQQQEKKLSESSSNVQVVDLKQDISEHNSSFGSMSNWSKKMYKIDKNGYLMDNQSKYILSPKNAMIKVPQTKISEMESSGLIQVQKWDKDCDDSDI